jgi:predicted ATPase
VRLALPNDAAALRAMAADRAQPWQPWPGSLLASFEFDGFPALLEWARLERSALARQWRDATLARLDAAPAPGRITCAQALLELDPLDEHALVALLRALREGDRGADADRAYESYRDRLARELGAEPSPALRALAAPPAAGASQGDASPPRAFVGRRSELSTLARAWTDPAGPRLQTLVGPGGAGKSRLARQAVAGLDRPVTWIDLQDLSRIDEVAARIAQRVGLDLPDGADAPAALARELGALPRLLVLDNAEHLQGLGAFAGRLLAATPPTLRLLATSRRPLGGADEALVRLQGLAVPDAESRDAEAAAAFDAVRLFELRARAVQPGFQLARHVHAVLAIVDATGALPLAIELAAAWVRLLPPEEIAAQLQRAPGALERDPAAAALPARPEHASLGVVLERSWALLAAREREALMALTVFAGGFTTAAAGAVADASLPVLAALADAALLEVDDNGRFHMHPLVAADAAARAAAAPAREQREEREERHAEHFATWLEALPARYGHDLAALTAAIDDEAANLRAAWRHAAQHGRLDRARRMLPAWRQYFERNGRHLEACRHLRAMLDAADAAQASLDLAHLRAQLAHFLVRSNQGQLAQPLAQQALHSARALGDATLERIGTSTLGGAALALSQFERARECFERVRELNLVAGDRRGEAAALNSLAYVASYRGDFAESLARGEEAAALYRSLAHHEGLARCLMYAAQVHAARHAWPESRQAALESMSLASGHGASALAMIAQFLLGAAELELGRIDLAERHLERVRERCAADGDEVFGLKAQYYLARIAARRGRTDDAARAMLAAARRAYERRWPEDLHYLAIFLAELLRDAGHAAAAAAALRTLVVVPDADSDAMIRSRAQRVLSELGALAEPVAAVDAAPLDFDALAGTIATAHGLDDLAARLVAAR